MVNSRWEVVSSIWKVDTGAGYMMKLHSPRSPFPKELTCDIQREIKMLQINLSFLKKIANHDWDSFISKYPETVKKWRLNVHLYLNYKSSFAMMLTCKLNQNASAADVCISFQNESIYFWACI